MYVWHDDSALFDTLFEQGEWVQKQAWGQMGLVDEAHSAAAPAAKKPKPN